MHSFADNTSFTIGNVTIALWKMLSRGGPVVPNLKETVFLSRKEPCSFS